MPSRKLVVVFGATGNQGGSVAKAILGDPVAKAQFHLRAVTRDPSQPTAISLAEKGVNLVKANLNDKDSLRAALEDAYAVFSVTNFGESMDKQTELQQGKNVADVAKELNVQHLIWSSLPNVSKVTDGELTKVIHFDGKAEVEEHIRSIGIPATFILMGAFMPFTLQMLAPIASSGPQKSYKLSLLAPSETKWPLISVNEDTGKIVKAILLNREKVLGKQFYGAVKEYKLGEIVQILKERGGLDVTYEQISEAEFMKEMEAKGFPEFFRNTMIETMRFGTKYDFLAGVEYYANHQILSEPLETYEEWVANDARIRELK